MAEVQGTDFLRRIAVAGPGAIGTLLAVRLAIGGCDVTVLDHRRDRAARLQREGLRLATPEGTLRAPVAATTSARDLAEAELVLVCVKCPALLAVGRTLAALPQETCIATLQNGLGIREALVRGLGVSAGRHTVLAAVTYQAASPNPDGTIRHVANLPTVFDGAAPVRQAAEHAAATFESAGLPARVEPDLRLEVWRKLIVNAAINPPTALARVANGALADRADLRAQMLALAREAAQVARAEGLAIGDDEAEQAALRAAMDTAANISSMRQDVEAGRPTEIEFLSAAVLRLARKHGLRVPETRRATEAILRLRA